MARRQRFFAVNVRGENWGVWDEELNTHVLSVKRTRIGTKLTEARARELEGKLNRGEL